MISSHIPGILLVCFVAVLVVGVYLLDLCCYRPRRQRRAMERARLKVERLRREEAAGAPPGPRDYHYAISFDSDGFTVADLRGRKHESAGMRWSEITRATAFKRDLFAIDCICLFLARADGTGIELDEEMARWMSFVEVLPQQLPGCKLWSEWFSAVAFPAFVPNETVIYERTASGISQPITGANAA